VVVGSTTVKPGETGTIYVSVIMHKGMGGPHLFHIFVRNSDPENRVIILKVKADIVPLETWKRSHPGAFYLPREVAGFKLGSESVGIEVIPESLKAFGYPEELKYAYLGKYGKNKKHMRLLATEYTDIGAAKKNFSKMVERLEKIGKKSNQIIKRDVAGNTVYSFKKGDKENLYFQIDDKVLLLFVEGSLATQSLEDVLKHIQAQ
jgi:hypothetical protein